MTQPHSPMLLVGATVVFVLTVGAPATMGHVSQKSFGPAENYESGHAHRDEFEMGDGADSANLLEDDDLLKGEDGFDGINSPDALIGGIGPDRVLGGRGKDDLYGHDGADDLNGNDGDDLVRGAYGGDGLDGGLDDDTLIGGPGVDSFSGASGDDYLDAGDDQANEDLHGGPDYDVCIVDATSDGTILDNPSGCQVIVKDF